MTWICPTCDAMWNRHSLSARNPECHECQHEICGRCDSANCFTCGTILHVKCSVTVGEDDYCHTCGSRALMQQMLDELAELSAAELQRVFLLAKSTMEELLIASTAIAEYRKKDA